MTTEIVTVEHQPLVAQPRSFFAMQPKEQINYASEIATVLADVIQKQKLYSDIQGKKYVKVEGWQTLGTFLGVVAKERSVNRFSDGSYEAFVDLIKFSDGTIVGGGSALCSINEKRWGNADEYARRSMSITRATGKAFRSAFAWIVTLAGYEPTPEEEMPTVAAARTETKVFNSLSIEDMQWLTEFLEREKKDLPKDKYILVANAFHGHARKDFPRLYKSVINAQATS